MHVSHHLHKYQQNSKCYKYNIINVLVPGVGWWEAKKDNDKEE